MEEGLSAVKDEYFENFDKPDKKHESGEYVCGKWASEKGSAAFLGTATRTASPSRNLWMTRDTCTVSSTGTVTIGKQGWLSTTWTRNLGTRPHVVRSPNMWTYTFSSVVGDVDRDTDQVF